MSENNGNFIPTLDGIEFDRLTNDIDKIAYVVGFTLINPGFTSNLFEDRMLSLSTIVAENPNSLDDAAAEFKSRLQAIITQICTKSYFVAVQNKNEEGSDVNSYFEIIVVDEDGNNILRREQMLSMLKINR
jgi:hypothetical protein